MKGRIVMLEDLVKAIPAPSQKQTPATKDSTTAKGKGNKPKGNPAKPAGKTNAGNANASSPTDTANAVPTRPQAETDFIQRNYGKYAYGTAIDIVVLSDDKVDVKTFLNVKSRSGKVETQWGVTLTHADGSTTEYLVSGENPSDALNDKLSLANTEGNGGTAKASVHHGDGPDGDLSSSELE